MSDIALDQVALVQDLVRRATCGEISKDAVKEALEKIAHTVMR